MRRIVLGFMIARIVLFFSLSLSAVFAAERPNIVYIMSDELAYYELGHMGSEKLKTPNIDAFAEGGIRFTNALAGAPVCGPLRCNLLTGKHAGHASVRANDGGTALRADERTIGAMMKEIGYATGGYGKWGNGGRGSSGVPEKHGFDDFFGYYDQVHAHTFYPPYLVRNSEEVPLKGNIGGRTGETYSHYEIMREGLNFIRENKDDPFFAYFPITPPHGMYDIPADDPAWDLYAGEAWMEDPKVNQEAKNYAAMVSMIDRDLGDILALLEELGLRENTVVFFTGDNGGQDRFKDKDHPRGYFGPNVNPKTGEEFRAGKGSLYDGGLKIPFLVQWPGKVAPKVSDHIFYQPDMMVTIADLTGATPSPDHDGISIAPTLLGEGEQEQHEMLYWEYNSQTAVRKGMWKIYRGKPERDWELYDLSSDISESNNIAADHADLVAEMAAFAEASHEPAVSGTYADPKRTDHEKDRWAKWGTSKSPEAERQRARMKEKALLKK